MDLAKNLAGLLGGSVAVLAGGLAPSPRVTVLGARPLSPEGFRLPELIVEATLSETSFSPPQGSVRKAALLEAVSTAHAVHLQTKNEIWTCPLIDVGPHTKVIRGPVWSDYPRRYGFQALCAGLRGTLFFATDWGAAPQVYALRSGDWSFHDLGAIMEPEQMIRRGTPMLTNGRAYGWAQHVHIVGHMESSYGVEVDDAFIINRRLTKIRPATARDLQGMRPVQEPMVSTGDERCVAYVATCEETGARTVPEHRLLLPPTATRPIRTAVAGIGQDFSEGSDAPSVGKQPGMAIGLDIYANRVVRVYRWTLPGQPS
jgi:hypothetical protein